MNFASFFIIFVGAAIAWLFGVYGPKRSVLMSVALYAWHTLLSIAYFQFATSSFDPDSLKYFMAAGTHAPFGVGTDAIFWLVSFGSDIADYVGFNFSYLDYFLVFNIIGYIGLSVLLETLYMFASVNVTLRRFAFLLVMTPGIGFWTSALGKDAIVFLGVALMVFGSIRPTRRWGYLLAAFGLLLFARPYMLAVAGGAVAVQLVFNKDIRLMARLAGVVGVVIAAFLAGPLIINYVSLDNLSVEGVSSYVSTRQGYNLEGGGAADIASYNVPERIFTYLYRPLFFDAQSAFGLLASVENLVFLGLTAFALIVGRRQWRRLLSTPAGIYNVAFASLGVLLGANVTANLGIAVRQKTMVLPSIFLVLFLLVRFAWAETSRRAHDRTLARAARDNRPGPGAGPRDPRRLMPRQARLG